MADEGLDSSISEYLAECEDLLLKISEGLQLTQSGQGTSETIDSLYRYIHTIKGSSQLFGFIQIGEMADAMETSLEPIRKSKQQPSHKQVELFIRGMDAIDQMICSIKSRQEKDFSELLASIIPDLVTATQERNKESIPEQKNQTTASTPPVTHIEHGDTSSTIRVPVVLLDRLMTLTGEIVLIRNQVLQYAGKREDSEILNLSQRLNLVTNEIQSEVMKTRMQPIGTILTRFQRVVRDLERDLGKQINLVLSGTETELDKTLLEAIKDPLMHIVRNSCDHGIEPSSDRKARGKSETGQISIKSFHERGHVIVEVTDDGRGLDRQKIINKAIEKNLITSEKTTKLSDQAAFGFIFSPGFTTATEVTNISGRGVGMDVVKTNIESIGGVVEVESQFGKNTTIRLNIPLTLAIIPAMIVRSGSDRFVIPQSKLVELVRVEKDVSPVQIESIQGTPVYRLRENLLPLISLKDVLQSNDSSKQSENEVSLVTYIVVLNVDQKIFGLIVDEVQDTAEVVVKPLTSFLKSLTIYSGATVLGDGSIALILDVVGIAQKHKILSRHDISTQSSEDLSISKKPLETQLREFLLFNLNSPTKYGISLSLVHRLEEFDKDDVQFLGDQPIVRYRNTALPIISLNKYLNLSHQMSETDMLTPSHKISVIVSQWSGRLFGIEVNEILDVVRTTTPIDEGLSDRPGILGNLMTSEDTIIIVNVLKILDHFSNKLRPGADGEIRPEEVKPKEGKKEELNNP